MQPVGSLQREGSNLSIESPVVSRARIKLQNAWSSWRLTKRKAIQAAFVREEAPFRSQHVIWYTASPSNSNCDHYSAHGPNIIAASQLHPTLMPDLGLLMATITSSKGVAIWNCDEAATTIKTKKPRKFAGLEEEPTTQPPGPDTGLQHTPQGQGQQQQQQHTPVAPGLGPALQLQHTPRGPGQGQQQQHTPVAPGPAPGPAPGLAPAPGTGPALALQLQVTPRGPGEGQQQQHTPAAPGPAPGPAPGLAPGTGHALALQLQVTPRGPGQGQQQQQLQHTPVAPGFGSALQLQLQVTPRGQGQQQQQQHTIVATGLAPAPALQLHELLQQQLLQPCLAVPPALQQLQHLVSGRSHPSVEEVASMGQGQVEKRAKTALALHAQDKSNIMNNDALVHFLHRMQVLELPVTNTVYKQVYSAVTGQGFMCSVSRMVL